MKKSKENYEDNCFNVRFTIEVGEDITWPEVIESAENMVNHLKVSYSELNYLKNRDRE